VAWLTDDLLGDLAKAGFLSAVLGYVWHRYRRWLRG
jgi:hypothetical protein